MQAVMTTGEALNISREKLSAFVSQMFGGVSVGREDDEHPLPPGPWDPVIRKVAKKVLGPHPEPWQVGLGYPVPWRSELEVNRIILASLIARHPEIGDVIGGGRFTADGAQSAAASAASRFCRRLYRRSDRPRSADA